MVKRSKVSDSQGIDGLHVQYPGSPVAEEMGYHQQLGRERRRRTVYPMCTGLQSSWSVKVKVKEEERE